MPTSQSSIPHAWSTRPPSRMRRSVRTVSATSSWTAHSSCATGDCRMESRQVRRSALGEPDNVESQEPGRVFRIYSYVVRLQSGRSGVNMPGQKLVGQNYTPPDLIAKVTGRAKYAEDYRVEGMLFTKLLLSPMPHARVVSVDARAALTMPGVKAILRADELP